MSIDDRGMLVVVGAGITSRTSFLFACVLMKKVQNWKINNANFLVQ
jgi:hypothetical protein